MTARFTKSLAAMAVLLAAAQFIRPNMTSPPTDPARTIQAAPGTPGGLAPVLDRSCGDCHSNRTVSGWYTRVAPASWLMAHGMKEGRKVVNFSEWAGYSPDAQRTLLAASCADAKAGKMPGAYSYLKPDVRLSANDVETICAAASQAGTRAANAR